MTLLKEFFILAFISWLGSTLVALLTLPIPGAVLGLVILFLCLKLKWISLDQVETVGNWFQETMAFFFLPLMVGLIVYMDLLTQYWVEILWVVFGASILTFVLSGMLTEKIGDKE